MAIYMVNVDERILRLCDIEDIKALKARYCWYFDHYDDIANLFVPDGKWYFDTIIAAGRWMTDFDRGFINR